MKQLASSVATVFTNPTDQSFHFLPTSLHGLAAQQHDQKLIRSALQYDRVGSSQARPCVRSNSSLNATPAFPKHLICILPPYPTLDNLLIPSIVDLLHVILATVLLGAYYLSELIVFHTVET